VARRRLSHALPAEAGVERLLRMLVALEETVIRLEHEGEDKAQTIRRLKLLQGEIVVALRLLEGDFSESG
jgi:hypothetical protein